MDQVRDRFGVRATRGPALTVLALLSLASFGHGLLGDRALQISPPQREVALRPPAHAPVAAGPPSVAPIPPPARTRSVASDATPAARAPERQVVAQGPEPSLPAPPQSPPPAPQAEPATGTVETGIAADAAAIEIPSISAPAPPIPETPS